MTSEVKAHRMSGGQVRPGGGLEADDFVKDKLERQPTAERHQYHPAATQT